MKKITLFIQILMMLLFFGCTRTIYEPVVKSHVLIDTVMQTVTDSAVLRALFDCDSLGNVRLSELHDAKGKMAQMETRLQDGELKVVTRWQTKYVDRLQQIRDTVTVVEVREVVRTVKRVPAFFWWCFGITLGAVGLGLWKLFRRFSLR